MRRVIPVMSLSGLLTLGIVNTPQEPEHALFQGDVANPNLELRLYGDKGGLVAVQQHNNNDITYVMTLLCASTSAMLRGCQRTSASWISDSTQSVE